MWLKHLWLKTNLSPNWATSEEIASDSVIVTANRHVLQTHKFDSVLIFMIPAINRIQLGSFLVQEILFFVYKRRKKNICGGIESKCNNMGGKRTKLSHSFVHINTWERNLTTTSLYKALSPNLLIVLPSILGFGTNPQKRPKLTTFCSHHLITLCCRWCVVFIYLN